MIRSQKHRQRGAALIVLALVSVSCRRAEVVIAGPETPGMPVAFVVVQSPGAVNDAAVGEDDVVLLAVNDEATLGAGGEAIVTLGDQVDVRMLLSADVRLVEAQPDRTEVFMEAGHLRVTLTESAPIVRVETPDAVITTLRSGTVFTLCQAPGATCLAVHEGEVEWQSSGATTVYTAGQSSFAESGTDPGAPTCISEHAFAAWFEQARTDPHTPPLAAVVLEQPLC